MMRIELDHLFVCTAVGAPEGDKLVQFGLREGPPNQHPGLGICLRPVDSQDSGLPFPGGEYRPPYLPDPLLMLVGEAGIEEPMWVYLSFQKRVQYLQRFAEHPAGIREISGLTLTTRVPLGSSVLEKVVKSGTLTTRSGVTPLLEIEFDGQQRRKSVDFRPDLPLVFQL